MFEKNIKGHNRPLLRLNIRSWFVSSLCKHWLEYWAKINIFFIHALFKSQPFDHSLRIPTRLHPSEAIDPVNQQFSNHSIIHCRKTSGVILTLNKLFIFVASSRSSQALRYYQQLPQHWRPHQNVKNFLVFIPSRFRSFVGTNSAPSFSALYWSVWEECFSPLQNWGRAAEFWQFAKIS